MDAFLDAWLRGVYPLRRKFGFTCAGAWRIDGRAERYYCAQARSALGKQQTAGA